MNFKIGFFIGIYFFFTTSVFSTGVVRPNNISNLILWLRADSSKSVDIFNNLSQWDDVSGSSNHATQATPSNQPKLILATATDSFALISFSGTSFLDFSANPVLNENQYTIFWIGRVNGDGYLYDFGGGFNHATYVNGSRIEDWNNVGLYSQPYVKNRTIILSKVYNSSDLSGAIVNFNLNFQSINRGGKYLSSSITNSKRLGAYSGNGLNSNVGVHELIIFKRALNSTEMRSILGYLQKKYAPPISITSPICLKLGNSISVKHSNFTSYLWSTSATTPNIAITQPGEYWVKGTDIFGQVSSDTIQISQIINTQKPLTNTVCINDTLIWDTKLSSSNYAFSWNGNTTTTSNLLAITTTGSFNLQIQDLTTGCIVYDTLHITSTVGNSLQPNISLGTGDTSVCSGNAIGLIKGANLVQNYKWSTGSIAPQIDIVAIGKYIVKLRDISGCSAKDSINVLSILGFAPTVNFKYDSICAGKLVNFSDLSVPPQGSTITKRYWQFDNGVIDSVNTNPTITSPLSSVLKVKLSTKASNSCSNAVQKLLTINPEPKVSISSTEVCSNISMNFAPVVTLSSGFVSNWNWDFDAGATAISNAQNPQYTYTSAGAYNVKLNIKSNRGCINAVAKTVNIKQSIPIDFSYSSECFDQTVFFRDISIYPDNISAFTRTWDLGDSTISSLAAPSKKYQKQGVYAAKLTVVASNGCTNTKSKSVMVKGYPKADFNVQGNCQNQPVKLLSTSTSLSDSISTYNWAFGSRKFSTLRNPEYVFTDSGSYPIKLEVMASGCRSDTTIKVVIHPQPKASFVTLPTVGTPPLKVNFINNSKYASSYLWNFSNGTSSEFQPSLVFNDEGNYQIKLVAISSYGCKDSISSQVLVNKPIWDIALRAIASVSNPSDNLIKINAKITNYSNRTVDSIWLNLQLPNNYTTSQLLKCHLVPNEDTVFTLSSFVKVNSSISHYCLSLKLPNQHQEVNLENNSLCEVLASKPVIYDLYPNPSSGEVNLSFSLPESTEVSILIADMLGRTQLTSSKEYSKGYYVSSLNTENLSNGMYVIQIKVADIVKIQKIRIQK